MPRRSRIIIPGEPISVLQNSRNGQLCFFSDQDYLQYLQWLRKYAGESECSIHAYVLMPTHIHILLTPSRKDSVATLMKHLAQRYVQYINRIYQRTGTLWEGRFRSCVVQQEKYLLSCQQFVELNPVRSDYVSAPTDYRWSSYRANAFGENSILITPHPLYLNLGKTHHERQIAYRKIVTTALNKELVEQIRQSTNGNYVLGEKRFTHELAKIFGRRVTQGKPGRPRKNLILSGC